jgi:ribosomal protein S18 acetylase RimI-like enzyme
MRKTKYRQMSAAESEKEFYGLMGKFFASAAVRKDFDGYPINNEPSRQWIIALIGDKVVGFGSFDLIKDDIGQLFDAWVDPDYRRNHIYRTILDYRMQWFIDHEIKVVRVVAYPTTRGVFESLGFAITRVRGKYAYMEGTPVRIEGRKAGDAKSFRDID